MSNSKRTGFAIVKISKFQGENATIDVNGNDPLYLHPVCGNIPDRNVLAGTVAANQGFVEGQTFLAQYNYGEVDPKYGQRVNWTNVSGEPMSPMDIVTVASGSLFNGEAGSIYKIDAGTPKEETSSNSKAKADKAEAQAG